MKAEILSVGTELLMGQIVNTDAQYIARRLTEAGVDAYYQQTVGDNLGRLREAIALAASRSDIVFLSGGLGPTEDDLTKETVAAFCGLPMEMDPKAEAELRAWFAGRGAEMTPNNLKQAAFPKGSKILPNRRGTAPGCVVEKDGKRFVVLPGPPHELQDMFEQQVMPYLASLSDARIVSHVLHIFGIGESSLEHQLKDLIDAQGRVTIAPYAGFGEVSLRLSVKCGRDEDPTPYFDAVEPEIRRRVGRCLYGVGDVTLPRRTVQLLLEKNKTLSLAESCTGGRIASELVGVPGVSASLLEGCVSYSNEAKVRTLGVERETLARCGAVSAATARQMAQGMRRRTGSDYALATTGIAGPDGGSQQKPVGLVYVALADAQGVQVKRLHLGADRERVRRMATLHALDLLRRALEIEGGGSHEEGKGI